MANTTIQLRKSATPGSVPSAGSLANGELALNFADGIIYYKAANGSVAAISSGSQSFGTINASGTLLISDTVNDVLDIVAGSNIIITGDAVNDRLTIAADLAAANNWANTKLANTSGVSFAGDLYFPSGNVAIGTTSPAAKLHVINTAIVDTNGTSGYFKIKAYGNDIGQIRTPYSGSAYNLLQYDVITGGSHTWSVSLAEKMRLDANGNVGIGTTSPGYKLEVAGDAQFGATGFVRFVDSAGGNGKLVFPQIGSIDFNNQFYFRNAAGTVEYARFLSGNFGIGTASPMARMHVAASITGGIGGNAPATTGNTAFGGLRVGGGPDYDISLDFGVQGNQNPVYSWIQSRIQSNYTINLPLALNPNGGNVGVGTSAPAYKLDVAGEIRGNALRDATNGNNVLNLGTNIGGSMQLNVVAGQMLLDVNNDTNGILFRTGATISEKMRITNSGNVGIGTSSPATKLDVTASGSNNATISLTALGGGNAGLDMYYNGTFKFNVGLNGGSYKLYNAALSTYSWIVDGSTGDLTLALGTAKISVGTTSAPTYKLDIVGDVRANSFISGNSSIYTSTVVTSTATDQILDSFTTTTWRSANYVVTMTSGTDYHTTQVSLIHDGTNAYITEYGTLSTANNLGIFNASVVSGTVRLNVAPTFAATTINMVRTTNK